MKILAQEIKFDILCLNETKLDARIDDDDICITGYTSYRRDRDRYGGGVIIYVADSLESYPIDEFYNKDIEALWTKICLRRSKPLVIGAIYRPPGKGKDLVKMGEIMSYMSEIKSKLDVNQEVHICGDFNCNMLKRTGLSSSIHDICNLLGSKGERIAESGVIHASISDHSIVYAIRKGKRLRVPPRIIQTRSFKAFISEKFEEDLFNSNWNSVYEADNVHGASKAFTEIVNEVADRHAPKVNIRVKGNLPSTFSDELILLMKERDNAKLIAARTKLSEDWNYYKKLRNRVNRLKHHEKKNYFNEALRENIQTQSSCGKN